jgi:hypothetical protein
MTHERGVGGCVLRTIWVCQVARYDYFITKCEPAGAGVSFRSTLRREPRGTQAPLWERFMRIEEGGNRQAPLWDGWEKNQCWAVLES